MASRNIASEMDLESEEYLVAQLERVRAKKAAICAVSGSSEASTQASTYSLPFQVHNR
jgi:hypothetical protein